MLIDGSIVALAAAIFAASMLQSATGIGYGVIAGPIFLAFLDGREAFQISTAHNFLIALIMVPWVIKDLDRPVLRHIIMGSAVGIPAGFVIQGLVSIVFLKVFSALIVGMVAVLLALDIRRNRKSATASRAGHPEIWGVGLVAGAMGGILAMPGPVASTWMSLRGHGKNTVRSTVLAFFIFAYGTGLILNVLFADVSASTLWLTGILSPVVVVGIMVGAWASRHMTEAQFRFILLAVLVLTAASVAASI